MVDLVITRTQRETPGSKSFFVEREDGQPILYKAGQFLTLMVNRNCKELRRSYSFASAPETDREVFFTVKEVPNGEVSRYLLQTLQPGSRLTAQEPTGRFIYEPAVPQQRDIFLVAAGSGVTPVYALAKRITTIDTQSSVTLILQNHDEQQSIFYEGFHKLAWENDANLRFHEYLSRPEKTGTLSRRLNNEILEELIKKEMKHHPDRALFYICGPLSFMRMAEFTIRRMGFSPDSIKKEIFEVPRLAPPAFTISTEPRTITFTAGDTITTHPIVFPASILDVALSNHIPIPYSCKAGICGSCVMRCMDGQVKMKHNDVLTDEEVESGLILTCVGYAETDITISP